MIHLEGIPISPGYASGVAVVYDYEIERRLELPHRAISQSTVDTECKRLDDALDYIAFGQDSVGVVVADVSGHGLGPSLLMAKSQAYLHAFAESHDDPGDLLTHANRLFGTSNSDQFVTTLHTVLPKPDVTLRFEREVRSAS